MKSHLKSGDAEATDSKFAFTASSSLLIRNAQAVDFSAASALPLPLPRSCSYSISTYPTHECGSGWPEGPLLLPLPHPWLHKRDSLAIVLSCYFFFFNSFYRH